MLTFIGAAVQKFPACQNAYNPAQWVLKQMKLKAHYLESSSVYGVDSAASSASAGTTETDFACCDAEAYALSIVWS